MYKPSYATMSTPSGIATGEEQGASRRGGGKNEDDSQSTVQGRGEEIRPRGKRFWVAEERMVAKFLYGLI